MNRCISYNLLITISRSQTQAVFKKVIVNTFTIKKVKENATSSGRLGLRPLSRAIQNLHLSASQKVAKLPEVALAYFSRLANSSVLSVFSRGPNTESPELPVQPTCGPGYRLAPRAGRMRLTSP